MGSIVRLFKRAGLTHAAVRPAIGRGMRCAALPGIAALAALCAPAGAATLTTLYTFYGSSGSSPIGGVVQASNGVLYGTTEMGGASYPTYAGGYGSIYSVTTSGLFTQLHSFYATDGAYPSAPLIQGSDGLIYGMAFEGGSLGWGTVFSIATSGGTLNTPHTFTDGPDGGVPYSAVYLAKDGSYYGTTTSGGRFTPSQCKSHGCGNVFKMTVSGTSGTITPVHEFAWTDGDEPNGAVVEDSQGNFYGTTSKGGVYGNGTLFKISSGGQVTVLHQFQTADGAYLNAPLTFGPDGALYGTSYRGGANGTGTIYKITSSGAFTLLHTFVASTANCGTCEGLYTQAALTLASDGNFYGTTQAGGTTGAGTVYEVTPAGTFTNVYSFTDMADGSSPYAGVIQGSDGALYGTTLGGPYGDGTVFKLTIP